MKWPSISRLLAALAIGITTCASMHDARAWTGLDSPSFPHWGTIPVSYYINRSSFPENMADVAEQRIRGGFLSWSAPNCTYFDTLLAGDLSDGTYDIKDGKNVILWINKPNVWPQELGPSDSVIGVTLPVWSNDGNGNLLLDDADIIFNNIGFCWYDYDPKNPGVTCSGGKPVDALSILTHEQGHFLGLGHTSVSGATMEPAYLGGNDLASLEQDDIDGVCALYPIGGISGTGACDVCRGNASKNECASKAKACTSSCLSFGDCLGGCPKNNVDAHDACAAQCSAQFNDGVATYTEFNQCVCGACAKACANRCAGPSNSSGSGPCSTIDNGSGGQTVACDDPDFDGEGGCGCVVGGREAQGEVAAMIGVAFAVFVRRRRRG